jgi:hypothetical protein
MPLYAILGGGRNTGCIIANSLLSKGERVRVVGRDLGQLMVLTEVRRGGMQGCSGTPAVELCG